MGIYSNIMKRFPHLDFSTINKSTSIIIEGMADALMAHRRVEVRGFGSFSLVRRKPRNARNPRTGESVKVKAKYAVHFKPGKDLRSRVNGSRAKTKIKYTEMRGRPPLSSGMVIIGKPGKRGRKAFMDDYADYY